MWTLFSLLTFMTFPMMLFVSSNTIVDRLGIFIVPLQIFVLSRVPTVFSKTKRENFVYVFSVILYSFAVELIWLTLGHEAQSWIPYRNYLWEQWF